MMKVIDLFSGCGGMSLGFQNAGFKIEAAFDYWQPAINVYKQNFAHPIFKVDLKEPQNYLEQLAHYDADVIIGGPPCQDFSSAGKRDESLGRADLTIVFAEIIAKLMPTWFVMENVDRALKANAYKEAKKLFKKANYGLTEVVLDASFYEVPQKRKRLFLVGKLGGHNQALRHFLLKRQTHKPMTLRDYFGNSLGIEHYYRHPWSYARRGVFSINEPSPTVRGVNRPIPKGYPGHRGDTAPVENLRPLTTKERSRVQTFPEEFILHGTKGHLEQMIGNAVPVKLAEHVAKAILEYKTTSYKDHSTSVEVDGSQQLSIFDMLKS